ncbi:hypothetical protein EJ03DRAFT_270017 [Teratosphaeria nubilosa]|uniref:GH64 domain-containing protein n=1 Tax=Teratosphaeria nubilosa TaxID=161662 RepID=A0A6G1LCU1_9PEZI|nr:hypothetical protein EJ03DRAFT_270017 [Teratosphaeria nubilosa]
MPITEVYPGGVQNVIVTSNNTLNATAPPPANATTKQAKPVEYVASATSSKLPLAFTNNYAGNINAYVQGLDSAGQLVFLQSNGEWYYPTASSSVSTPVPVPSSEITIPVGGQGSTLQITLPGYLTSGRIYFANGNLQFFTVYVSSTGDPGLVQPSSTNPEDPNAGLDWGFIELTNTAAELYADVTYVDFVGIPLGLSLKAGAGTITTAKGVQATAVTTICNALVARQQSTGYPWGDLCQEYDGKIIRVIGPQDYISLNPGAFEDLYADYVNEVWSHYETSTLTINTQAAAGDVACTVSASSGLLECAGDNRGYAKPTTADIFGCNSGPFAIESGDNAVHYAVVPRLCAAFDRSTLLISGGNVQPMLTEDGYYSVNPTNHYSQLVHEQEIDGLGYAFAYDDVSPNDSNGVSGFVVDGSGNPQLLQVTIGGPSS